MCAQPFSWENSLNAFYFHFKIKNIWELWKSGNQPCCYCIDVCEVGLMLGLDTSSAVKFPYVVDITSLHGRQLASLISNQELLLHITKYTPQNYTRLFCLYYIAICHHVSLNIALFYANLCSLCPALDVVI